MRHTLPVLTCCLVTGLLAGCTSTSGESEALAKLRANAEAQADNAEAEAEAAEQASQDYSYAQRAQFVDETRRELDTIHNKLEQLTAKVEMFDNTAKADARTKLVAVKDKWTQAKKQLDLAESATESDWDQVQGGLRKDYRDLNESFDTMRQWISDKIAPEFTPHPRDSAGFGWKHSEQVK